MGKNSEAFAVQCIGPFRMVCAKGLVASIALSEASLSFDWGAGPSK